MVATELSIVLLPDRAKLQDIFKNLTYCFSLVYNHLRFSKGTFHALILDEIANNNKIYTIFITNNKTPQHHLFIGYFYFQ